MRPIFSDYKNRRSRAVANQHDRTRTRRSNSDLANPEQRPTDLLFTGITAGHCRKMQTAAGGIPPYPTRRGNPTAALHIFSRGKFQKKVIFRGFLPYRARTRKSRRILTYFDVKHAKMRQETPPAPIYTPKGDTNHATGTAGNQDKRDFSHTREGFSDTRDFRGHKKGRPAAGSEPGGGLFNPCWRQQTETGRQWRGDFRGFRGRTH